MACDGAPNSNKELTYHSYVCPHVGMRFKVKTGERISMVTNLSDCVGCTCLKGQENTTLLHKKPVSCVKVFIEDGRIFAWEKSASPIAQDSSASIETCTRCGKVSERNSGVEIMGEISRHYIP